MFYSNMMKVNQLSINTPSLNSVSFKSIQPKEQKQSVRAEFFPETVELMDRVYDNYKKSLGEVSFAEIKSSALKIAQETQTPKKEVLQAMQLLTQFANMKSLIPISETLNRENVAYLGNADSELCFVALDNKITGPNVGRVCSETGIHRALTYVLDKKKLAPFEKDEYGFIGLILDNEKIEQLEKVKATQPKEFDALVKSNNIRFFYLSGFDTGISVFDRTQNLEEKTKELLARAKENNLPLDKAIDYPNLERIKALGIKPVVIKNENNQPTEISVYNQMRPEQISTRNAFYKIVESNTNVRSKYATRLKKTVINDISARYLDETLSVYTPERMSQDLKTIHKKIEDYAKSKDRDIVYVIPNEDVKSTDLLNYSYRKINGLDSSNFVNIDTLPDYFSKHKEKNGENTLLVILDDCALSGNSMSGILNYDFCRKGIDITTPVLFACLKCSEEALQGFMNSSTHPAEIMYLDKINYRSLAPDGKFQTVIGKPAYRDVAYSVVFPYMAPDNNSQLASNIALLHNPKYNSQNFSTKDNREFFDTVEMLSVPDSDRDELERVRSKKSEYGNSSKTLSDIVLNVSADYISTLGQAPQIFMEADKQYIKDSAEKYAKALTD